MKARIYTVAEADVGIVQPQEVKETTVFEQVAMQTDRENLYRATGLIMGNIFAGFV